jgi:hypothetical protein
VNQNRVSLRGCTVATAIALCPFAVAQSELSYVWRLEGVGRPGGVVAGLPSGLVATVEANWLTVKFWDFETGQFHSMIATLPFDAAGTGKLSPHPTKSAFALIANNTAFAVSATSRQIVHSISRPAHVQITGASCTGDARFLAVRDSNGDTRASSSSNGVTLPSSNDVLFTPNDAQLALSSGVLALYQLPDFSFVGNRTLPGLPSGWWSAFSPDGGTVLAHTDTGVRAADFQTGTSTGIFASPVSIRSAAMSSGNQVVAGLASDRLILWNRNNGQVISTIMSGAIPWGMDFSGDGSRVLFTTHPAASTMHAGGVHVHSSTNGQFERVIAPNPAMAVTTDAARDRTYLVTHDMTVKVVRSSTGETLQSWATGLTNTATVRCKVSPDGQTLLIACSGRVAAVSTTTGGVLWQSPTLGTTPAALSVRPDSTELYVNYRTAAGGASSILRMSDGAVIAAIGGNEQLAGCSFSPDGSRLFAVGWDAFLGQHFLRAHLRQTGSVLWSVPITSLGAISAVSFSGDARTVVFQSDGSPYKLQVRRLDNGALLKMIDVNHFASATLLNANGARAVLAERNNYDPGHSIRVVDTKSGITMARWTTSGDFFLSLDHATGPDRVIGFTQGAVRAFSVPRTTARNEPLAP